VPRIRLLNVPWRRESPLSHCPACGQVIAARASVTRVHGDIFHSHCARYWQRRARHAPHGSHGSDAALAWPRERPGS
jgi:hypothetical protein